MKDAFSDDHDGNILDVKSEDVFLAIQTTILVLIIALQIFYYNRVPAPTGELTPIWSLELLPTVKFNRYFVYFILGLTLTIIGYFFLVVAAGGELHRRQKDGKYLNWVDYVYFLSIIKLISTLVKYVPQIMLNQQRQSTSGFNIWTVVFDFLGGIFSFLQVLVDSIALCSEKYWKLHFVKVLSKLLNSCLDHILNSKFNYFFHTQLV